MNYIAELKEIPDQVAEVLKCEDQIKEISKQLVDKNDIFYLGRGLDYSTAMEGALKIKEISYTHAEAFAAGELKHGTIALIEEGVPVIVLATQQRLFEKMLSNMQEVKARGANVISITDGQIYLQPELFYSGVRPAVDPGISVSRVGGSAQIKSMKKVSGTLKLAYSQYRELASFSQFGSDLDADTKRRLAQGERIVEVLKQGENAPLDVSDQVMIIFAVTNGFVDDIPVSELSRFESELFKFVDANYPELSEKILANKDFTTDLTTAINEFKKTFVVEA